MEPRPLIPPVSSQISLDGTGVYVGGERGGLLYFARNEEDGSLTLSHTWTASDFDEAIQVGHDNRC